MDLAETVNSMPYWYHRIELPGGIVTPGWAPINAARHCIPEDLTGKRVLDIGAWDGYWTWEALKRGATEVVAIDDFSDSIGQIDDTNLIKRNRWETFDLCREAFGFDGRSGATVSIEASDPKGGQWFNDNGQCVSRFEASVYDISSMSFCADGFDVVFFFGTFYHLKHPLLALEKISSVCCGSVYIETASLDEYSPYRGGIGKGFAENERVMEFYPTKEYGENASNWWAPTLECLGAMMHSVGFKDIECWPLTETPADLSECRGFASGTKDPEKEPALHPSEILTQSAPAAMKVAAVMSVPRLGFQDNMTCAIKALQALRIPLINVQGAFWGQILERGMESVIDAGFDVILTIDYDTVFSQDDIVGLLQLLHKNPEAAAIIPIQTGRIEGKRILTSVKGRSGNVRKEVPLEEFRQAETLEVATGHFGLTALRVKDLLDIGHPWFWDQPNSEGRWGPGRVDADIWFWKQLEKAGKRALLATRIVVGHLELLVGWPDESLQVMYQMPGDFHDKGKPKNCWK
jgi:tRNA (mo5U34)-methyltransferase